MNKPAHINFWLVQLLGWGSFVLLNTILQGGLTGKNPLALDGSIVSGVNGLVVTAYFRSYIHRKGWRQKRPGQLIFPVILATAILAIIWAIVTVLIVYVIALKKGIPFPLSLLLFVGNYISGHMILFIWSALYFAYQYFQRYNQAAIEKWQLEATAKEAQLGFLKSQINPHFLFNALNNIRALILEDPGKAREMLTHLSGFLRYPLQHSTKEWVALETELEIVHNYLELVTIQYEDQMRYDIACPEELQVAWIPPMIIQLLVENAVKHGVANSSDHCELSINITRQDQMLNIEVANTGHLHPRNSLEEKLGVGLNNIRSRLQLLYDKKTEFSIIEMEGWVIARIVLPLRLKNNERE